MSYKKLITEFIEELQTVFDIIFDDSRRRNVLIVSTILLFIVLLILPADVTVHGIVAWTLLGLIFLLFKDMSAATIIFSTPISPHI